jgi:hypothetical protein
VKVSVKPGSAQLLPQYKQLAWRGVETQNVSKVQLEVSESDASNFLQTDEKVSNFT